MRNARLIIFQLFVTIFIISKTLALEAAMVDADGVHGILILCADDLTKNLHNNMKKEHYYLNNHQIVYKNRTWNIIYLCSVSMLLEIIFGILFNSIALVSDGIHMCTHVFVFLMTAFSYSYAEKHRDDPQYMFGTGKIGDLVAYTSAIMLIITGLLVFYEAIQHFLHVSPINYVESIPISIFGLVVNIFSGLILMGVFDNSNTGTSENAEIQIDDATNRVLHECNSDGTSLCCINRYTNYDYDKIQRNNGATKVDTNSKGGKMSPFPSEEGTYCVVIESNSKTKLKSKPNANSISQQYDSDANNSDRDECIKLLPETVTKNTSMDSSDVSWFDFPGFSLGNISLPRIWSNWKNDDTSSSRSNKVNESKQTSEYSLLTMDMELKEPLNPENDLDMYDTAMDGTNSASVNETETMSSLKQTKYEYDLNYQAAVIHVLADAAVSGLVCLSLVIEYLVPTIRFLDPIIGIIGAIVIISWGVSLVRDTSSSLLDMNPDVELTEQLQYILELDQSKVVDLHVWRLGPGHLGCILSIVPPLFSNSTNKSEPSEPSAMAHDIPYYMEKLKPFRALSHITVEILDSQYAV